jgi:hypothetical protein
MLTLGTVVEALTGQAYPFLDQVVTDGAIDSRLAIPGSLFVALRASGPTGTNMSARPSSAARWRPWWSGT